MPATHPPPGAVFQFRKGGDVLLARALGAKAGKLIGSGEDGRKVELPLDRVLQVAGEIAAALSDADARTRLRDVRSASLDLVPTIDLGLLWEQVRGDLEGAPIEELVALYFGRSGSQSERIAFGFAVCADRVYFRQKGDRFVPRMQAEVEAALERRQQEAQAAERRAAFIAWACATMTRSGAAAPPPEGAEGELAAITELAVHGDDAHHGARAKTLLKEIEAAGPRFPPTPDGAFDALVRLGVFGEHENLALRRSGIPTAFSPDLLAIAADIPAYARSGDGAPRRALPPGTQVFTVDDVETQDRDDAVSLERLPDGGLRVGIHIACVAHFIPRGSPLDEEAQRRGTTVYLPRMKLPMFPRPLSEGRMSLDADGAERPALSYSATLAPDLSIVSDEIHETVLTVTRNLSYEEVDAALDGVAGPGLGFSWPDASVLAAFGERLLGERLARGALDLRTPEVKLIVSDSGTVLLKRIDARSRSRALVAELMILANTIAARFCRDRGIPAIFRRQAAPQEPLPPREAFDSPEVHAFEVRRRIARTEMGPAPGPHFTLGLECYVQATSPIRRYQDLVVERQILAALRGEPPPYSTEDVTRLAGSAEAVAGETAGVERDTVQYWLLRHLAARRGEPLDAVVLMERDGRYLVELAESLFRTFVRPRARWAVGARVRVRVEGANPRRGEVVIVPA